MWRSQPAAGALKRAAGGENFGPTTHKYTILHDFHARDELHTPSEAVQKRAELLLLLLAGWLAGWLAAAAASAAAALLAAASCAVLSVPRACLCACVSGGLAVGA